MNCRDALLLLEFARPGATELEAADIVALETHLADCRACSSFAKLERDFADQITTELGKVPNPQRGPSYLLRKLNNRHRSWSYQSALTITIFVFAGLSIWGALPRPKLDPDSILENAQIQIANRQNANSWLVAQDSRFEFPPRFRPQFLVNYERRSIHGTAAPVLTFVRGDSLARVTVLTANQFRNLSEFADGQVAENSVGTLTILRHPGQPEVVYLVEVFNGPLNGFLESESSPIT